ncbi:OsmC family protein [Pseudomonas sp. DWP3-1-2]|uniref:OsmC family protein n=1 Tax=Pseudomonas sp. DWP3-1-2 TaxID=2804645 RepID=UPI003CF54770
MSVIVSSLAPDGFRHKIAINERHELFTDLPTDLGGEDSAPSPHDYFDAALAACKTLTLKLYAQQHNIPLTGISVDVSHDDSEERQGKYHLNVQMTLEGALSDEQRTLLHRIADRCPVHKLMTRAEISIETTLA